MCVCVNVCAFVCVCARACVCVWGGGVTGVAVNNAKGQRSSSGFVNDPLHLQPGNTASITSGLALRVVKIGRYLTHKTKIKINSRKLVPEYISHCMFTIAWR
jgi:hypothetical protein